MSTAHKGMWDRVYHKTILVLIFSYVACFGMVINHRKPLRLPQSWQNNCLRIGFHSHRSKAWWTVNWTAFTHLRKKTVSLVSSRATFWIKIQRFGEVGGCENTSMQALNDKSGKGSITFWKKQSHRSLGCLLCFHHIWAICCRPNAIPANEMPFN